MAEAIMNTLQTLATPTGLLYMIGGSLIGVILGAIPGLGGGTITILLLPMTYRMDPTLALALFMAIYVGSTSGGCIGSILLGIPGTNSSIVTCWDGYPLTRKGDPVRPLSAAVVSNFIGTVPSLILAVILCLYLAQWAVKLGPWEYFALCYCAIAMVIGLSKGNVVKGLIACGLGILAACVGSAPLCGTLRFTFGSMYLISGLNIVNLMMGMFAGRTILMEYTKGSKASEAANVKVRGFKLHIKDYTQNIGNMIRSFIMGAFIGFLPGLGANTSTVLAYANEKNIAEKKHKQGKIKDEDWVPYGEGNIGGVIAPETANNAGIGGAMIPMIALGIPGNGVMTIFMTAMTVHGINAGPLLLKTNPEVVYMLYTAAIIAAIIILVFEVVGMPIFPAMLKCPYHFLYPAIIIICILGSYISGGNLFSVGVALATCALGIFFSYFQIPQMPFILAFILCSLLEKNFRSGMNMATNGLMSFFTKPFSCIFIILGTVVLFSNIFMPTIQKKLEEKKAAKQAA